MFKRDNIRVFIWGTSNGAKFCLESIKLRKNVSIIGLLEHDNICDLKYKWGHRIITLDEISRYTYDYIIINSYYSIKILNVLTNKNIETNKLLFVKGHPNGWKLSENVNFELHINEYKKLKTIMFNFADVYEGNINKLNIKIKKIFENKKFEFVKEFLWVTHMYYKLLRVKKKDEVFFILSSAIGDSVFALAIIKQFKEKYRQRIVVYVDKKLSPLLKVYEGYDEIRYLSGYVTDAIISNKFYAKNSRKTGIICTTPYIIYGYRTSFDCLKLFRRMFELSGSKELQFPKVLKIKVTAIPDFYRVYNKIVIINPYSSNQEKCYCELLLQRLAVFLKNSGFIVYSNIIKKQEVISGTLPLQCSYIELYEIARYIPLVISIRSGILDFIVSAGCSICAIYPDISDIMLGFGDMFTLKQWDLESQNIMEEYLDNESESYERIVAFIKKSIII